MAIKYDRSSVTVEEYAEAVETLLKMAQRDSGGSRSCAQVLLSCYNDGVFHLACTDLCNLDDVHFDAAMKVLMGRVGLMMEPHRTLIDGTRLFDALWDQWKHLTVKARAMD